MAGRNYWLDLFTPVTWQEFLKAGARVSGFRETRWSYLEKTRVGDYFLCYLTGISRWIGLLEITSEPFLDSAPIWKEESFPCRVKVKVVAKLTPETAIPVKEMRDQLSAFKTGAGPLAWTGHFRRFADEMENKRWRGGGQSSFAGRRFPRRSANRP